MAQRLELLVAVADRVAALPQSGGILRVGIDGVDGAGKTTFADELATILRTRGRSIVRASVDSFHNPKAIRYRLGRASPEGFFADSYDYSGLKEALLDPLGAGGSGRYRTAIFDHTLDLPVSAPERAVAPNSILILDGIFLHRAELRGYWDVSIFLDVAFQVSIPRGAQRGTGSPDPDAAENRRYIEGQRLYLRACDPRRHATITIDNNDLAAPRIIGRGDHEMDG